jgi:N-acetylmuramoyl-L-alanine amidase
MVILRKVSLSLFLLISIALLSPYHICAEKNTIVNKITHFQKEHYIKFVLHLDGDFVFSTHLMTEPEMIYFDLNDCELSRSVQKKISFYSNILKRVRLGQFSPTTVRCVMDIEKIRDYRVTVLKEIHQFIVEVYGEKYEGPILHGSAILHSRIVIDPGHGGKDKGAIGPTGLREKDVVLDIAKKLRHILIKRYSAEVIMTRERDIFRPLKKRAEIANKMKADLFISIHANASDTKALKGLETYTLNWTNDKEAEEVAERENAIFLKEESGKMDNVIQSILSDLARSERRDKSLTLADNVHHYILSVLKKDFNSVEDNGIRQGMFYLLVGVDMPSILTEVSYISNLQEEKRLKSDTYRYQIAEGIAAGINSYFTPVNLTARQGELKKKK